MTSPVFIFDFDSTLVRIETLEALADIALSDAPDAAAKKAEIAALTDQAMTGQVDFGTALRRRLDLLSLTRSHVEALSDRILDEASASIRRNVDFFERHAERVYILSGGFREVIAPLAARLGIAGDHVLANDLIYDAEGRVTGVDDANPLSRDNGKPEVITALNLTGPVVMVGDGSFLMLSSELATAVAEGIKIIIVLIQNHGYASIGHLSETLGSERFGTKYRRYDPDRRSFQGNQVLPVDLAMNARSYGVDVIEVQPSSNAIIDLKAAMALAKASTRTTLIHINSDTLLYSPDGEGWWDVPVAAVSTMPATQRARKGYENQRAAQRPLLGDGEATQ